MICEKCGKEIGSLKINVFDRDGSDCDCCIPLRMYDNGAVEIETTPDWCGYELTEEEQMDRISCPICGEFPFKHEEVQVYDVVKVVCFTQEDGDE